MTKEDIEHEEFRADKIARLQKEARAQYLRDNPDVGVIIRDGEEVFYRFENGELVEIVDSLYNL